jgi:hypothetical protein
MSETNEEKQKSKIKTFSLSTMNFFKRTKSKAAALTASAPQATANSTTTSNSTSTSNSNSSGISQSIVDNTITTVDADGKVTRIAPGFNPHLLVNLRTNEEFCFEEVRARLRAKASRRESAAIVKGEPQTAALLQQPLPMSVESRRAIAALINALVAWKPHFAPPGVSDLLSVLTNVELERAKRDQHTPGSFAVPRLWLDALRHHTVAPTLAPPPPPMPLNSLDVNATSADAAWVSEESWQALCASYGSNGAWQRGGEPSIAVRITSMSADDRPVVLLVPYRASVVTLFARACAAMCVAPRGRRLVRTDAKSVRGDTCGELFLCEGGDVRNPSISDVRHPPLTLALSSAEGDSNAGPSIDEGLAQLARCTDAVAATQTAAKAAFAALLEWRASLANARTHLTAARAAAAIE